MKPDETANNRPLAIDVIGGKTTCGVPAARVSHSLGRRHSPVIPEVRNELSGIHVAEILNHLSVRL